MYRALSLFVWSRDLPPTEKFVLVAIATAMNDPGQQCYKSEAALAKDTGLGKRTVTRAIVALVERGLLHIEKRHHEWTDKQGNTRKTKWLLNHYSINPTSADVATVEKQLVPESQVTGAIQTASYSQSGALIIQSNHPKESSKSTSHFVGDMTDEEMDEWLRKKA